jgi:Meiotically up-regulated gene 113
MLFLLDGLYVQVRHLQRKGDSYYYNPSHLMRKAGYDAMPLGRNMRGAIARAAALNAKWDADENRRRLHERASYEQNAGFVYFVSAGPAIKVGFSRRPSDRIDALKTGSQFMFSTIGIAVGAPSLEREIHRKLRAFRCDGHGREWFRDVPEVRAIISSYLERYDRRDRKVVLPNLTPQSQD